MSTLPEAELTVDPRTAPRVASEYNKAPKGECAYCDRERELGNSFHPAHNARPSCQSGRHNHCSCDTCF